MRATLIWSLPTSIILSVSSFLLVDAAEIKAEKDLSQVQTQNTATTVIQVAQVLVIDQNDVLSIAADMAVAAAIAAAGKSETPGSDRIEPIETSKVQGQVSTIENEIKSDMKPIKNSPDGITAGENVEEGGRDDAVTYNAVASSAVAADGTLSLENELNIVKSVSEKADVMPQPKSNTVSASDIVFVSMMTESEFTFSPITLAPESSKTVRHNSPNVTQKPSAHITPHVNVETKIKSNAITLSVSIYWPVIFISSQYILKQFL